MNRLFILLIVGVLSITTASASLLIKKSGISKWNSKSNKIMARQSSGDFSRPTEWIAAWAKIPPRTDWENGSLRYQVKVLITAPDNTIIKEGPFNFDPDGYFIFTKQIAYFSHLQTTKSPIPATGKWTIDLVILDNRTNQEDLGAALAINLTGTNKIKSAIKANLIKSKKKQEK